MKLKVGDTAEVIEITDNSYPMLYENGAWGAIEFEFPGGSCSAIVGNTTEGAAVHGTYLTATTERLAS